MSRADELARRRVQLRGGAEAMQARHRGTKLGIESRVAPGWADYRGDIESRPREVHEDVLRREGFDRDRAREIAAASSEMQARELDRWRGERLVVPAGERPPAVRSGWDIRSILPDSMLTDEEREERARVIAERDARMLGGG